MSVDGPRLDVGIVGCGRTGAVIAAALAGAGHRIVGVSSADAADIERAQSMLGEVPVLTDAEVIERSQLVWLALPEADLVATVQGAAELGLFQRGALVVHTVAGLGCAPLDAAMRAGAIPLAIHPAMMFTGTSIDVSRLQESTMAVTCAAMVAPIGQALVIEMGAEPVMVAEEHRAAYAEALDVVTGFSRAIVGQAVDELRGIGMIDPARILRPVALSAVARALDAALPDSGQQEEA